MRSLKVTLSRTTEDGQFRISALNRGEGDLPVDTNAYNLVMQILRLKAKPMAPTITDFVLGTGILGNNKNILG